MGAIFIALRGLGVRFRHVFGSETDRAARATLLAHAVPEVEFAEDIYQQDVASLPTTDLYLAGFPCQTFSGAGLQQGFGTAGILLVNLTFAQGWRGGA